jgi:hypothetical protein
MHALPARPLHALLGGAVPRPGAHPGTCTTPSLPGWLAAARAFAGACTHLTAPPPPPPPPRASEGLRRDGHLAPVGGPPRAARSRPPEGQRAPPNGHTVCVCLIIGRRFSAQRGRSAPVLAPVGGVAEGLFARRWGAAAAQWLERLLFLHDGDDAGVGDQADHGLQPRSCSQEARAVRGP